MVLAVFTDVSACRAVAVTEVNFLQCVCCTSASSLSVIDQFQMPNIFKTIKKAKSCFLLSDIRKLHHAELP